MISRHSTFLSILLASFAIPAVSHAQRVNIGGQGEVVEQTPIATLVSSNNQSEKDFMLRVGNLLSNYTQLTEYESCATICRSSAGQLGVLIVSNSSHVGCALVDACPTSMAFTGKSIHSHPPAKDYIINHADRAFLRARTPGVPVAQHEHIRPDTSIFSEYDYLSGPGYLVVGRNLWFQSGVGRVVNLGLIPTPSM
jgi:hypothetical protein